MPDRAIVCPNTFTLELLPGVLKKKNKNLCAILSHFLIFRYFFICLFLLRSLLLSFFSFSLFALSFSACLLRKYLYLSFLLSLFFLPFFLSLSFSLVIYFCFDNTCLYSILVKQLSVSFQRWTTTKSCENNLPASW